MDVEILVCQWELGSLLDPCCWKLSVKWDDKHSLILDWSNLINAWQWFMLTRLLLIDSPMMGRGWLKRRGLPCNKVACHMMVECYACMISWYSFRTWRLPIYKQSPMGIVKGEEAFGFSKVDRVCVAICAPLQGKSFWKSCPRLWTVGVAILFRRQMFSKWLVNWTMILTWPQ